MPGSPDLSSRVPCEQRRVSEGGGQEISDLDGWTVSCDREGTGSPQQPEKLSGAEEMERDVSNLLLMRLCRHHILANSSFSWWGAWTNETDNSMDQTKRRIVLAPDRWFNNRAADGIYTARMERIGTD